MSEGRARGPHPNVTAHQARDEVTVFRTSSFSGGGDCVEVGDVPGGGAILRDTKDPARRNQVALDPQQWAFLLTSIKSGELDPGQPHV